MNFEFPAEIYFRLSSIPGRYQHNVTEDVQKQLNCIRLESSKGNTFAIASNRKIAAIYYIENTGAPDGVVHLDILPGLLKQCETEIPFNSTISVTAMPELGIVSLKTTMGYVHPGNGGSFPAISVLEQWRAWFPKTNPDKSSGAMAWFLPDMVELEKSSPTGQIAFPQFINALEPIVLRDINYPNWIGLFMANKTDDQGKVYTVEPATIPKWCDL